MWAGRACHCWLLPWLCSGIPCSSPALLVKMQVYGNTVLCMPADGTLCIYCLCLRKCWGVRVILSYSNSIGGRGYARGVSFGMVQCAFDTSPLLVSAYLLCWLSFGLAQERRGLVGGFLPSLCGTGGAGRGQRDPKPGSLFLPSLSLWHPPNKRASREWMDVQLDMAHPWWLTDSVGETWAGIGCLRVSQDGGSLPCPSGEKPECQLWDESPTPPGSIPQCCSQLCY